MINMISRLKVLFITPHLSTGGAPQYLLKKIQSLNNDHDIYCVEYSDITGGVLVVQRNQIKEILGNKLITLNEDKNELITYIVNIAPDIIHFEELPEYFCDYEVAKKIYIKNRSYKIIETSHDSSFDINDKLFFPDKFIFVSEYQKQVFAELNIPTDVLLYPITYKEKTDRTKALTDLGLDPNKTHFLNVGLFTSRKNQKEIIEYARKLINENVQFHFVGNQADNFKWYWEPLMKEFPSNCKWWGERKDVDTFYNAMDVFLFTSRGTNNDKETNPLVIREAIGWKMPLLMYNLPVYCGMYNNYSNITFLDSDLDNNLNIIKTFIKNKMKLNLNIWFEAPNLIHIHNNGAPFKTILSVRDNHTNIPIYYCPLDFFGSTGWFVNPIPVLDFSKMNYFSEFLLEFYDENKNLIDSKVLKVKDTDFQPIKLNYNFGAFDCLFINYRQMFYEDIYKQLDIDNLDTILDIGANVGLFSLYMLNRNAKNIHCFEPTTKAFDQLKNLLSHDSRVHLEKMAVYNINGKMNINICPDNSTISGLIKDAHDYSKLNNNTEEVDVTTIPDFLKNRNIRNVDLIKIDIEGAEYDVLNSLSDEFLLSCNRYLIEYHNGLKNNFKKYVDRFEKLGFEILNPEDPDYTHECGFIYAKKKDYFKKCFVTVCNQKYEYLADKLVESVIKLSDHPIIVYNYNGNYLNNNPRVKVININENDLNDPVMTIPFSGTSHIGIVDRTDKNTYNILTKKLFAIKDCLDNGVEEGLFLDCDGLVSFNIDEIFEYSKDIEDYPLLTKGLFEYMMLNGNGDPYKEDPLEVPLMKLLNVDNRSMHYVQSGIILFNNRCKQFFDECLSVSKKEIILDNTVLYAPYHDETIINVLLWKKNANKMLPISYFNLDNSDVLNKFFLSKDESHFLNDCPWHFIPENKLQIKYFHGCKFVEEIDKCLQILLKKKADNSHDWILHMHLFLNKPHLEEMAFNNIKNIKRNGFKILVTSPQKLPERFYEYIDIFYFDHENQLFENHYDGVELMYHWSANHEYNLMFGVAEIQKHGLAVLRSMIKGCKIALMNNIKNIIKIEYDNLLGDETCKNLKSVFKNFYKNKTDIELIRNVYPTYSDVSLHLMFYDCKQFLNVFGRINDEKTYNDELIELNQKNRHIFTETFVYLLIEHYKNKYNIKVNYLEPSVLKNEFKDALINQNQNFFSSVDGILSDVTYVTKNNIRLNKIGLGVRNFYSTEKIDVMFDIFYKDGSTKTIILNAVNVDNWTPYIIDEINNIKSIYIKNNKRDYFKLYKIDNSDNILKIINEKDNCESSSVLQILN